MTLVSEFCFNPNILLSFYFPRNEKGLRNVGGTYLIYIYMCESFFFPNDSIQYMWKIMKR